MESSKEQLLFEIEIFCNVNVIIIVIVIIILAEPYCWKYYLKNNN